MNKNCEADLWTFFSKHKSIKYKKGEVIMKPGEKTDFVGFIKTGFVRVYTINDSGQEITMSFFKPILYFTTIYMMTGTANKFYFEAITPVELYRAPANDFMKYCKENPQVANEIMARISNIFLGLVEHVGVLLSGNSLSKVAKTIISIVDGNLDFAITHKMVASLTGLTRETVTLQMLKLERMKLIDNKNRSTKILDRKGLDKIIGS